MGQQTTKLKRSMKGKSNNVCNASKQSRYCITKYLNLSFLASSDCTDLPTLAMKKVFAAVLENFIDKKPGACFQWILGLVCGDVETNSPDDAYDACAEDIPSRDDASDMERLFEKGSLNNFAENCVVSRLAWDALKESLQARRASPTSDISEMTQLFQLYQSKCLGVLNSLRGTRLTSNARVFSRVYQSLMGLLAVGHSKRTISVADALESTQEDGDDAVKEQLVGFVSEVTSNQETSGISFHPTLRTCLQELCSVYKLETALSP